MARKRFESLTEALKRKKILKRIKRPRLGKNIGSCKKSGPGYGLGDGLGMGTGRRKK